MQSKLPTKLEYKEENYTKSTIIGKVIKLVNKDNYTTATIVCNDTGVEGEALFLSLYVDLFNKALQEKQKEEIKLGDILQIEGTVKLKQSATDPNKLFYNVKSIERITFKERGKKLDATKFDFEGA